LRSNTKRYSGKTH